MDSCQILELAERIQKLSINVEANTEELQVRDKQIIKCESKDADASTCNRAEDRSAWCPVRHPKMPVLASPRYFVDMKQAVIYSNATGRLRLLKPTKRGGSLDHTFRINKKNFTIKLAEIMVYTFWEKPFDSSIHWFFYKDGNRENCAWDNLVICDLPTLQQLEIARVEKLNPGTKYTVVRNVHDTLTFERYLVSDTGEIYSLKTRRSLRKVCSADGYFYISLCPDKDTAQATTQRRIIYVHSIVIQSFKGRRIQGLDIDHYDGDKLNNRLQNLAFVTRAENLQRAYKPVQMATRKTRKQQGDFPSISAVRPLPPITEETKWKPIGTLPWIGRSFNKYEVSDAGHVRRIVGHIYPKSWCTVSGYAQTSICCDDLDDVKDNHPMLTRLHYFDVPISRLVASAYVDGYSDTRNIVKHLNGEKQDNRAQNLKWITKNCSSRSGRAYQVVATLVDNPEAQKEFASRIKAEINLCISLSDLKPGGSKTRYVNWDDEKKQALIEVLKKRLT